MRLTLLILMCFKIHPDFILAIISNFETEASESKSKSSGKLKTDLKENVAKAIDVKDKVTHPSTTSSTLSNNTIHIVFRANDRSSQEEASEADKKSIETSDRTKQRKHRRRHKSKKSGHKNNLKLNYLKTNKAAVKANTENSQETKALQRKMQRSGKDEKNKNNNISIRDLGNKTFDLMKSWINSGTDEAKSNTVLKNITDYYLQIISDFENKSKEKGFKTLARNLSEIYGSSFNKFMRTIDQKELQHDILKSIIIRTIDVFHRVLGRLFAYTLNVKPTSEKHHPKKIENEMPGESNVDLDRACLQIGICRTRKSFTAFIMDFFSILLSLDNYKFEKASNALYKTVMATDFSPSVGDDADKSLKQMIEEHDSQNLVDKRSDIAMIKNIYNNRNSPLIVFSDDKVGEVNKTVALIEIINDLDSDVPESMQNLKDWNKITHSFLSFETSRDFDIEGTMRRFIDNIHKIICELNVAAKNRFVRNFNLIF